jgi:hypothetical protein
VHKILRRELLFWLLLVVAGVVVILLIALLPLHDFFARLGPPPDDWKQFKADLLAVFIAAAVAIPIGLWLNRTAERRTQERELAARMHRLRQVLQGLIDELRFNQSIFEDPAAHKSEPRHYLPLRDARTAFWDRAAADLSVIGHPILTDRLAVAYYFAEMVNVWRRHLRENFVSAEYLTPVTLLESGQSGSDTTIGAVVADRIWPRLLAVSKEASRIGQETLQILETAPL